MKRWLETTMYAACFALISVQAAPGAAPQAPIDIAQDTWGRLHGQLLNVQGVPVANSTVALMQHGRLLASARTDKAGRFAFAKVSGGSYQLQTGDKTLTCRVWVKGTAPPAAVRSLLVIHGQPMVRGQLPDLTEPVVVGSIAAAAIVIPLALDDDGS